MKSKSELNIQITASMLIHTCLVDFKFDDYIVRAVAGGVGFALKTRWRNLPQIPSFSVVGFNEQRAPFV